MPDARPRGAFAPKNAKNPKIKRGDEGRGACKYKLRLGRLLRTVNEELVDGSTQHKPPLVGKMEHVTPVCLAPVFPPVPFNRLLLWLAIIINIF